MSRWDRREDSPRLPLLPGPVSNGEFIPDHASSDDLMLARETISRASDLARKLAMDRRRFLQSAGGMAVLLSVLNFAGCGAAPKKASASKQGGRFRVPNPHDLPECQAALGSQGEFIFDGHTHHVMPQDSWVQNAPDTVQLVLGMLPTACSATNRLDCVNRAAYIQDVFLGSDTTVALLTDVPNSGPANAPIPFNDAVDTQNLVAQLAHGGAPRLLLHDVIAPNFGALAANLDDMSAKAATGHLAAFKVYTAWGPNGRGYSLDDPSLGLPVVQRASEVGVRVICGHKGLPLINFDASHNGPRDMVAVAKQFPDMQFVVFHGAWDPNHPEGPYDPANASIGINSLLRAMDDYGLAPNSNIWADLGTVWRVVLGKPDQAAHVLGKLLSRVGEDRVLWGTDAIWYGSPQPQIMAFRAFEITPQFQETYGYPELTSQRKLKVLGLNGASLFGLNAAATRCILQSDPISGAKAEHDQLVDEGAVGSPWRPKGALTRNQMLGWLASSASPWTPA